MKAVRLTYIVGFASWLDDNDAYYGINQIKYNLISNGIIEIYYETEDQLFRIGFEYGKFYQKGRE